MRKIAERVDQIVGSAMNWGPDAAGDPERIARVSGGREWFIKHLTRALEVALSEADAIPKRAESACGKPECAEGCVHKWCPDSPASSNRVRFVLMELGHADVRGRYYSWDEAVIALSEARRLADAGDEYGLVELDDDGRPVGEPILHVIPNSEAEPPSRKLPPHHWGSLEGDDEPRGMLPAQRPLHATRNRALTLDDLERTVQALRERDCPYLGNYKLGYDSALDDILEAARNA